MKKLHFCNHDIAVLFTQHLNIKLNTVIKCGDDITTAKTTTTKKVIVYVLLCARESYWILVFQQFSASLRQHTTALAMNKKKMFVEAECERDCQLTHESQTQISTCMLC